MALSMRLQPALLGLQCLGACFGDPNRIYVARASTDCARLTTARMCLVRLTTVPRRTHLPSSLNRCTSTLQESMRHEVSKICAEVWFLPRFQLGEQQGLGRRLRCMPGWGHRASGARGKRSMRCGPGAGPL